MFRDEVKLDRERRRLTTQVVHARLQSDAPGIEMERCLSARG